MKRLLQRVLDNGAFNHTIAGLADILGFVKKKEVSEKVIANVKDLSPFTTHFLQNNPSPENQTFAQAQVDFLPSPTRGEGSSIYLLSEASEKNNSPFTKPSRGRNGLSQDKALQTRLVRGAVDSSQRAAFTLAEVLITLGIIGVVAAITMPSLVANYQKKVYITRLKKEVNVLENGVRKVLADEGVDYLNQSSLWKNGGIDPQAFKTLFQLEDMPENSKFYKWVDILGANADADDAKAMSFKDGSCVAVIFSSMVLDTNCDGGPNVGGSDRFVFDYEGRTNKLVDISSYTNDQIQAVRDYVTTLKNLKTDNEDEQLLLDSLMSLYGFHLIIYDGWEINY